MFSFYLLLNIQDYRDLTDKHNRNRIESGSDKQSKGNINISVVVIGNFCYGDWGSKRNLTALVSDHCLVIYLLYLAHF